MLDGLETLTVMEKKEKKLKAAEVKMLRFTLGGMRMDRVRNEYITGRELRCGAETLDVLGERHLKWSCQAGRKEEDLLMW